MISFQSFANRAFFKEHEKYIPKLPEYERILIDYYIRLFKQEELAKMMGCTQGGISSRLRRAKVRIEFLKKLEEYNSIDFEKLNEVFKPLEIEILKEMVHTTCQSATASIVNSVLELSGPKTMNQVKVRHHFKKCLGKLKNMKEKTPKHGRFIFKKHLNLLELVDKNLYTLHEVKLPHFDRG